MVRIPTDREPTHPGQMLLEEFLVPMNLTQRELADAILVPYQRVNELVNGRRGVTPSTALRLAKFFGNSEGFWMNLQLRWELYRAIRRFPSLRRSIASRGEIIKFGTRLVMVLGHSHCGAILATLEGLRQPTESHSPSLRSIVDRVRPSVTGLLATELRLRGIVVSVRSR